MGGSNENWGRLASEDPATAELWDQGTPLPDKGANALFDALLDAKHITRSALARTGCRMAEDNCLIWAWPGGAKWRRLDTGRRWNSLSPQWHRAHIMEPFDGRPGDVLLVAEGETDAARLSVLYQFAAVAVLPLGADYLPRELPAQAAEYSAVYACYDADEAGDHGAAKLLAAVPQAVRHRPPESEEGDDWCALPLDAEAPPLPKPPDACGSIVFEDFAGLLEAGVPDPVQLIPDVLYAEGVHIFSGAPGCGKTTVCAAWAAQLMATGTHVVWLDYEGGIGPTVRRFDAIGLPPHKAATHMHYAGWPPDAEAHLAKVAERWPGALIVFDSASKALSASGRDENSNTEVTTWTVQLVRAAKSHHLPLVVIDHTAKNGAASAYARGASAKQADADVHWRVETSTAFDRSTPGVVALRRSKDREGFFPAVQWFAVGDGLGKLPVRPCECPQPAAPEEKYKPEKSAF
jgi:hypothetical protein